MPPPAAPDAQTAIDTLVAMRDQIETVSDELDTLKADAAAMRQTWLNENAAAILAEEEEVAKPEELAELEAEIADKEALLPVLNEQFKAAAAEQFATVKEAFVPYSRVLAQNARTARNAIIPQIAALLVQLSKYEGNQSLWLAFNHQVPVGKEIAQAAFGQVPPARIQGNLEFFAATVSDVANFKPNEPDKVIGKLSKIKKAVDTFGEIEE